MMCLGKGVHTNEEEPNLCGRSRRHSWFRRSVRMGGGRADQPGLAKALAEAAVPLEQGLKASEREGKPISGKYELEDGAIQLSVYIMKGDSFNEVIVDHKSGAIIKSEPVEADDLQQAKEQAQALTHAKSVVGNGH